jgi:hypothetical protein
LRVLLIGARGFLGRHVNHALSRISDIAIVHSSRERARNSIYIDLNHPSSFAALDDFDVIVNCADSLMAPPDGLIEHCRLKGLIFLETSADTGTIQRILAKIPESPEKVYPGIVILGIGLFPGLSNILARSVAELSRDRTRMEVGVHLNLTSGAGAGMCRLMAESLKTCSVEFVSGVPIRRAPISRGIEMPFWAGSRQTMKVGLPETYMLRRSLKIPNVASYISPSPAGLRFPMLALGGALNWWHPPARWFTQGVWSACHFLRGGILCHRHKPVEITAIMDRTEALSKHASLKVSDGIMGTAYAIAAAVSCLRKRRMESGVLLPDQVFLLSEIVAAMRHLCSNELTVEVKYH